MRPPILGDANLSYKDTESYFTILHGGKTTRWIVRYWGDKKQPAITVCVLLTEERKREISHAGLQLGTGDQIIIMQPEHLSRIPGILFDALEYCKDDNNFKRKEKD